MKTLTLVLKVWLIYGNYHIKQLLHYLKHKETSNLLKYDLDIKKLDLYKKYDL